MQVDDKSMRFFKNNATYGSYRGNDEELIAQSTGLISPVEYVCGQDMAPVTMHREQKQRLLEKKQRLPDFPEMEGYFPDSKEVGTRGSKVPEKEQVCKMHKMKFY